MTSSDPTLYVWDLDETLIIFQTLRNGRYAESHKGSKDPQEACELGKRWESLILDICDDYFFYKQVGSVTENSFSNVPIHFSLVHPLVLVKYICLGIFVQYAVHVFNDLLGGSL